MRKPRPIGPLSSLTPDQNQQLRKWYDSMTYEQIAIQIALPPPEGFSLHVSVWQLRRYFQRLSLDDPSTPPYTPSISSIIDQAALAKPDENIFTPATIHLLEKRSFELALAHEDPRKISAVFGLVLRSRQTKVRERLTEVQKQKLDLRREIEQQKLESRPTTEPSLPFSGGEPSSSIPL